MTPGWWGRAAVFATAVALAPTTSSCLLTFDRPSSRGCGDECPHCCDVDEIPGGAFDRGWDRSDSPTQTVEGDEELVEGFVGAGVAPATLSGYRLDRYEVTRARFEQFANTYEAWRMSGAPRIGDGARPGVERSGWQPEYDGELPDGSDSLRQGLASCGQDSAWLNPTPTAAMNCVTWYLAMAFCIWDGGRLPSDAEWNYASAGGDEQRAFPWSSPPESRLVDPSHAVLEWAAQPMSVGSARPRDAARWGTHDLAGNVREWVLDVASNSSLTYPVPCRDCVDLRDGATRWVRGGDFNTNVARARSAFRSARLPTNRDTFTGVRCARDRTGS